MGFCVDCEKCGMMYDTKYFDSCPRCYSKYIESEDLKDLRYAVKKIGEVHDFWKSRNCYVKTELRHAIEFAVMAANFNSKESDRKIEEER